MAISFIQTSSLSKRQLLSPNYNYKSIYSLAREDPSVLTHIAVSQSGARDR